MSDALVMTEIKKPHYDGWEVGDFIHKQELDFFEGNVIKYVCRHKKKDGLKDLDKAIDYLMKLRTLYYGV